MRESRCLDEGKSFEDALCLVCVVHCAFCGRFIVCSECSLGVLCVFCCILNVVCAVYCSVGFRV